MKFRATLLAFLLLLATRGIARAELFYRDDLLKAIEQTGKELAVGKDRRDVLEGLDLAIEANPKSSYLPFSYADTAAEKLQMLTKEEFGYLPGGSPEERAAAIRRAQQWWDDEGSKRYTFDRIEALLRETANQSLQGTP